MPLTIEADAREGNYEKGTTLGGVEWNDALSDLRVTLNNNTNDTYEDVVILLWTDIYISDIGYIDKNNNGCSLFMPWEPSNQITVILKSGKTIPGIAGNNGDVSPFYIIKCDTVKKSHSPIRLVAAMLNLNPVIGGKWPTTLGAPRRRPRWAAVVASYWARYHKRTTEKLYCFAGAACTWTVAEARLPPPLRENGSRLVSTALDDPPLLSPPSRLCEGRAG